MTPHHQHNPPQRVLIHGNMAEANIYVCMNIYIYMYTYICVCVHTYTNTTWRRRSCIHSRTRCHASGESHPVFESHARILFDRFSTRCRLRSSTSMSCIREREGGEREQERERERNNERGGGRERDCVSVVKQHQGVIYGSNSKEITFYTGH
jgi:hypothetical protein